MPHRTGNVLAAAVTLGALCSTAHAAEGFQLRYNVAGSLGGEVFAPPDSTGFAAGLAATYIKVRKVTGNDGNPLTVPVPAGAVALPVPHPLRCTRPMARKRR